MIVPWYGWLLLVIFLGGGGYLLFIGLIKVPPGQVGVVRVRFAPSHPDDARRRVKVHGSPGVQAELLKADWLYFRPPVLYQISRRERTRVPPGTIGVVVARDGETAPVHEALSRHVECDSFQDGRAFLRNGGQKGRQPAVLPVGEYDINPELFDVVTVETIGSGRYGLTENDLREIDVQVGTAGVVIVRVGQMYDDSNAAVAPRVPGHRSFQYPWAFLENGGCQGVQEETLPGGGSYQINPWFARVVLIPTRVLVLEWSRKRQEESRFDSALDQIVVNVGGFPIRFDMQQTIQIPARAAPRLVSQFGEQEKHPVEPDDDVTRPAPVRRFVERVLGTTAEGYFLSTASEYKVLDFLNSHNEVRLEVEQKVRQALDEWDIEAVRTTLGEFEPPANLDEIRRAIASEREHARIHRHELENARIKAEIVRVQAESEAVAKGIRSTAEAEHIQKLAAAELEARIQLLGQDVVAMELLLAQLSKMNVPTYVGGDATALLQHMPLEAAREMINNAIARVQQKEVAGAPPRPGPPDDGTASELTAGTGPI
ncbi:SPFH domain-containing protein [Parafrankia sp. FMc6]|uniref:SPFH domain-containing protein n=1 Tax=Parafrankia soli TaxID=2599596 RepID=UPI0034D5DD08